MAAGRRPPGGAKSAGFGSIGEEASPRQARPLAGSEEETKSGSPIELITMETLIMFSAPTRKTLGADDDDYCEL